jgi:hypothetical protein
MKREENKEMQVEMIGVLTAISIVSKRLAARLMEQVEKEKKRENQSNDLKQEYLN